MVHHNNVLATEKNPESNDITYNSNVYDVNKGKIIACPTNIVLEEEKRVLVQQNDILKGDINECRWLINTLNYEINELKMKIDNGDYLKRYKSQTTMELEELKNTIKKKDSELNAMRSVNNDFQAKFLSLKKEFQRCRETEIERYEQYRRDCEDQVKLIIVSLFSK